MPLWTLVYVSLANKPMTSDELVSILEKSKANNAELGVTGILLYHNRRFMQALEGERDAVRGLYRKIMGDRRHSSCRIVYEREIGERTFGNWKMGFQNLDNMDRSKLEGFTDFLDQPLDSTSILKAPSRVEFFLNLFRMQT